LISHPFGVFVKELLCGFFRRSMLRNSYDVPSSRINFVFISLSFQISLILKSWHIIITEYYCCHGAGGDADDRDKIEGDMVVALYLNLVCKYPGVSGAEPLLNFNGPFVSYQESFDSLSSYMKRLAWCGFNKLLYVSTVRRIPNMTCALSTLYNC
jgi:hypothetical protein